MTRFEIGQARERYAKVQEFFAERCRQFGVCPEVSKRVEALLVEHGADSQDVEAGANLDPENGLFACAKLKAERLGHLCIVGQSLGPTQRPICGLVRTKS